MKKNLHWLWLAALVFVLDQVSKSLASYYLVVGEPHALLPFLNLLLGHNPGAAFSFLSNAGGWQRWVFAGISVMVSGIMVYWLYYLPAKDYATAIAVNLILGGALGNLWDRLTYGKVVDFIDFHVKNWHFATFNIADSAISIGAFILIICVFRKEKKVST